MGAQIFLKDFCIGAKTVIAPDFNQVDAVQLKSGLIVTEIIVTPAMAKEWLEKCADPNNRTIKTQRRNMYAADMKSGNWDMFTTDNAITFDEDGILKNGHHRLNSIVQSGVPVRMLIYLDASRNVKIFDRLGVRTTNDTLKMQGVDKALVNNSTIAVVKYLFKAIISSEDTISDFCVKSYLEAHAHEIQEAVRISKVGGGECYCKNAPTMSVIFCALRYGIEPKKLEDFCTVANTGVTSNAGFSSALFFAKYVENARKLRADKSIIERRVRNGMQLVGERAIYDFVNSVERKISYDPSKLKPCAFTSYVKKQDASEAEHLLGKS